MARQGARGVLVVGHPPAAGAPGANFVQFLAPPAQKRPPKHPGVMHPFGTLGIATGARCAPRRDGEGHCSTHPPPHGRHGTPPSRPCRRARRPVQGAQKKVARWWPLPPFGPGGLSSTGNEKKKKIKIRNTVWDHIPHVIIISFHFISFHFQRTSFKKSKKKPAALPPPPRGKRSALGGREAARPWGLWSLPVTSGHFRSLQVPPAGPEVTGSDRK